MRLFAGTRPSTVSTGHRASLPSSSSWAGTSPIWKNAANFRKYGLTLHIAPQIGGGFLRLPLEAERRDEAALLVHQIDKRGVIHAVVAVLRRDLLGIHP